MATRKAMGILLGILVTTAWVLGSASTAPAEELKCKLIAMMTKAEPLKIEDQEDHIMGTYERKGLMIHDNGEVANELNRGIFERTKDGNRWQGYCVQTFKDGSTMWMKHQGTGAKGKIIEATFEFIKGTGRFEGIKGQGTFTGEDYGAYNYLHFTGTYALPKK